MKIGILTFHEGINHGGFFQAFSTYSFLKSKGYDVEIINYKNKTHWLAEYKAFLFTKNPKRLVLNIKKILAFKKDQEQMNLGLFTKDASKIKENYDVIVVGSDIVWNYEWNFLGKDPVYFGQGLSSKKWISYAPSFGAIDCENTVIPDYVSNGLQKFAHISVRDENSKCIVKKASGKEAKVVLDPTFLLETNGMEKPIKVNEPFLLVYAYTLRDTDVSQTIAFAKKNKLKVVAVGYSQPWADFNIINLGPFEWIGYFDKAAYVLTGTFHGTLYSLKYRINFITSNNKGISNKTKTILSKLGLQNRLTEGDINFEQLYSSGIDYARVTDLLLPLIADSKEYLIEAVEND